MEYLVFVIAVIISCVIVYKVYFYFTDTETNAEQNRAVKSSEIRKRKIRRLSHMLWIYTLGASIFFGFAVLMSAFGLLIGPSPLLIQFQDPATVVRDYNRDVSILFIYALISLVSLVAIQRSKNWGFFIYLLLPSVAILLDFIFWQSLAFALVYFLLALIFYGPLVLILKRKYQLLHAQAEAK